MTLSKYGAFENFNETFNPRLSTQYMLKFGSDRMITSETAPTLTIVNHVYGYENTMSFLASHLFDVAMYFGNSKSPYSQIYSIAETLYGLGYYFKVTEWMLFFGMLKQGRFRDRNGEDRAKMYGNFSGEVITDCFYSFRSWRNAELGRIESYRKKDEKDDATVATPEQIKAAMDNLAKRWRMSGTTSCDK